MKYVWYELKKLTSKRYLWVFAAILLSINCVVAFFAADKAHDQALPYRELTDFYEMYFEDSVQMDAYYVQMSSFEQTQTQLWVEAMRQGDDSFVPETWKNKYAPDGFRDSEFFEVLYASIESAESYTNDMQKIIDRSRINIDELDALGISHNSYTYQYQLRVLNVYEKLRDNVQIKVEYSQGWNEFFSYETVNIFIFIVIVMFASAIFVSDKNSGMLSIVRSTKRGGVITAMGKLWTMGIIACVTVIVFSFATFLVFGMVLGYSSANNAIQSLEEFKFCPFVISIGAYFTFSMLVRVIACLAFSILLLTFSVVLYNHIAVYAVGAVIVGLNWVLYTVNYVNADAPLKYLNLWSVFAVKPNYTRFRAINFFGSALGQGTFMLVLLGVITVLSTLCTVWIYSVRHVEGIQLYPRKKNATMQKSDYGTRVPEPRIYTTRIVAHEFFKLLVSSPMIILILVILVAKICFASYNYVAPATSYDMSYKEYMTLLEGELTDEKIQYIVQEREFINSTLSAYDKNRSEYISQQLDAAQYKEYLVDYNYAAHHDRALVAVEKNADYLVRTVIETGREGLFVYDTGWAVFFDPPVDIFLLSTFILLFSGIFANEYAGRASAGAFAQILYTTKQGRQKTHTAKWLLATCVSAALALLFSTIDLCFVVSNYDLPAYNAQLVSLIQFSDTDSNITILQYTAVMYISRLFACVFMAGIVAGISGVTKNKLLTVVIAAIWVVLPTLLCSLGISEARYINYLNFLNFTPLYLLSSNATFDWGLIVAFVGVVIAMYMGLFILSRRKFCGKTRGNL